jgi:hypothetical protein
MNDKMCGTSNTSVSTSKLQNFGESMDIHGKYEVTCYDANGNLKWEEVINNVVCTAGKNLMLDNYISGSSFTQVGPYMGLISSVSWTAVAAGDTSVSHTGWTEAGSTNAPTFTARVAPAWSSASAGAKATSVAVSFTMTSSGTLQGAFLVLGTGAVVTLMSTTGTLFSAGAFSGGAKVVASSDVVNVSYSLSV